MTEENLNTLLSELRAMPEETEWLEFKKNNADQLGEYISALSNSACLCDKDFGYLVFGIEDKTHRIVGTKFKINKKIKGNEDLIPWISRMLEPRIHFEHFEFKAEEERVILFRIHATSNTPVRFSNVPYVRVGSYKKKLAEYPEKERLIWSKKLKARFESGIALASLTSAEVTQVLNYPSYFNLMGLPLPIDREAVLDKLKAEKLITNRGSKYQITNLGGILFAKRINDIDSLSRKIVRVIEYKGKNRLETVKEQRGVKGYASGFEGLINYINDQLPMNEVIGSAFRKEVRMYPELAIRELVANAIIHQDFDEVGSGPMIEIFEDRIEITNPGSPLIKTARFVDHNPQSRNEKLANFMRRVNICEERGSGIDKVIFQCELHQLPAPKFIDGGNYTRVILYAHKTLRQMSKDDKSRACYLHACLKHVSGEEMSNRTLRERFGIKEENYSQVSRIISDTIRAGMIKLSDPESKSKKHAKYLPFWA